MKKQLMTISMIIMTLSSTAGSFISVGTDQECDFNDIQSAINAGNELTIHITNQKVYREHLIMDGNTDLEMVGGFADCSDAESGQSSQIKTTVSGDLNEDDTGDGTVISITGNGNINLRNLKLVKGVSLGSGGLDVNQFTGIVSLSHTIIEGSHGIWGGGIGINNSPDAEVRLGDGLFLINNSASWGGGLYCNGGTEITTMSMSQESGISINTAYNDGGGVFLINSCEMTFNSGRIEPGFLDFRGIAGNQANGNGGGVAIIGGAKLYLTPATGHTVNISDNTADADDSGQGNGGGVFISGDQSLLATTNSFIAQNQAVDGGAFYVNNLAELRVLSSAQGCVDKIHCSYVKNNKASSQGGGIYVTDSALVELVRTSFEFNRADVATAIYADDASNVDIDYSVFSRNGANGADGFTDLGVIHAHNDADFDIYQSTLVDNYAEVAVFVTDMTPFSIQIWNSIIHDPSTGLAVDLSQQQENDLFVWCSMFHEDSGLYGNDVVVDDPQFIDRNGRDFNLNHWVSPAIDECFELSSYAHDYLGAPAGWDDPNVVGSGGGFDMGAFEAYGADVIFKNGFND